MDLRKEYRSDAAAAYMKMLKEGNELSGKDLVSALTSTCMRAWYELIVKYNASPEKYDINRSSGHDAYNVFEMTPGADVRDSVFSTIKGTTEKLAASLNSLFGKEVFEPRISQGEGSLETLVAFTQVKGGVFQCKASGEGGHTRIGLTMPKESELELAFSKMTETPHPSDGADIDVPGGESVAGEIAPDYDPDYDTSGDFEGDFEGAYDTAKKPMGEAVMPNMKKVWKGLKRGAEGWPNKNPTDPEGDGLSGMQRSIQKMTNDQLENLVKTFRGSKKSAQGTQYRLAHRELRKRKNLEGMSKEELRSFILNSTAESDRRRAKRALGRLVLGESTGSINNTDSAILRRVWDDIKTLETDKRVLEKAASILRSEDFFEKIYDTTPNPQFKPNSSNFSMVAKRVIEIAKNAKDEDEVKEMSLGGGNLAGVGDDAGAVHSPIGKYALKRRGWTGGPFG